jgi:hypothetical protein
VVDFWCLRILAQGSDVEVRDGPCIPRIKLSGNSGARATVSPPNPQPISAIVTSVLRGLGSGPSSASVPLLASLGWASVSTYAG